jgi:hypothetical protein
VWDVHALRWNYVRPGQDWEDGEVTSPTELEQCRSEKELLRALQVLSCCSLKQVVKASSTLVPSKAGSPTTTCAQALVLNNELLPCIHNSIV